jgi:hypothetical protein
VCGRPRLTPRGCSRSRAGSGTGRGRGHDRASFVAPRSGPPRRSTSHSSRSGARTSCTRRLCAHADPAPIARAEVEALEAVLLFTACAVGLPRAQIARAIGSGFRKPFGVLIRCWRSHRHRRIPDLVERALQRPGRRRRAAGPREQPAPPLSRICSTLDHPVSRERSAHWA